MTALGVYTRSGVLQGFSTGFGFSRRIRIALGPTAGGTRSSQQTGIRNDQDMQELGWDDDVDDASAPTAGLMQTSSANLGDWSASRLVQPKSKAAGRREVLDVGATGRRLHAE
jgi:hypothetical protein